MDEREVRQILNAVNEDDLYLSEEEAFQDSDSECHHDSENRSIISVVSSIDENQEPEQVTQNEEPEDLEAILQRSELELIWTMNEFIPRVHKFHQSESGLKRNSLTPESKEVDYFLSLFS